MNIKSLFLLLPLLFLGLSSPLIAAEKLNIVVILADDLGYGDVRSFNPEGKIATPHIDRLAREGMSFTDAHSGSAVCTPTRYGLLSGRYSWRSRLKNGVLGGLSPRLIEQDRATLASLLKSKGYYTGGIGKWHLGMDFVRKPGKNVSELNIESREQAFNVDFQQPIKNGPNSVGFDYYFGISASLDMVPYAYIENDRLTANPTEDRAFMMRPDTPKSMTRKGPSAPGFEARDVLPTLTQKAVAFLEQRAKQPETPFLLYLPLTAPHTPILPVNPFENKSGLGPYGDFVMQTDDTVGQVMAALDKHKLRDNTVVIFTSDNGCSPMAHFPELAKQGHNPSYKFRGHKADIFEGGHRVPFIVRGPGIAANTKSDQLVCLNDICRTGAEIAGATVPDNACEDSYSFLPTLLGKPSDSLRKAIVNHSINGSFAIRDGKWKLCLCPGSGGWSVPRPRQDNSSNLPPIQLFDLGSDIGETRNLQAEKPENVARLQKLLEDYVTKGRSTPGSPQSNTGTVDIWKAGKEAMIPAKKQ